MNIGYILEMYNDNVFEFCDKCLRVRISLYKWIKPSDELFKILYANKKYKILTLCHQCLKEVYKLKAVTLIKMCLCGNTYHSQKKIWFQISEMQRKNLNGMVKEGEVEIELTTCDSCNKQKDSV